jgi:hypothetical protein
MTQIAATRKFVSTHVFDDLLHVINGRNDECKIKYTRKGILGTHTGNSGSFLTARLVYYLRNDLGSKKFDLSSSLTETSTSMRHI